MGAQGSQPRAAAPDSSRWLVPRVGAWDLEATRLLLMETTPAIWGMDKPDHGFPLDPSGAMPQDGSVPPLIIRLETLIGLDGR